MLKNHTFKQGDLVRAKIKTYNEMGKPFLEYSQLYGIIVSEHSSLCYYRVEWLFRSNVQPFNTVDSLVHEDSIEIVKHGG
jgi:hypothetical protein